MAETTFSDAITALGDQIVKLTLKDAVDLAEYLKTKYGIEPAAGGGVMMAVAPSAPSAPVEEKTQFDVILASAPADKKIGIIKTVRTLTSLGLKEAKDLVEGAPKPVKTGVSKDDAAAAKKQLEDAGATVEVK